MKRKIRLTGVVIMTMALLLGLGSCEKDKSKGTTNEITKFLQVDGAVLKTGDIPASTADAGTPEITSVTGNSSVIEGGSNPVSVYTNEDVDKVLVGVQGKSGYYEYASSVKSTAEYYMISLVLSTDIPLDEFVVIIVVIDADGLVSQRYELPVGVVVAGTGVLQVSLSWDQENDLDLHLVEPNEEEIYFGNSTSMNGGFLDLDSNPGCYIDGIKNENITYSDESVVEAGTYTVSVDLWSYCSIAANTNYIVTARLNGQLISGAGITNPYYGTFAPDDEYNYETSEVQVMQFTISSSQLKSTAVSNYKTLRFGNVRTFAVSADKGGAME